MRVKKAIGLTAAVAALLAGGVTATALADTQAPAAMVGSAPVVNEDGEFYSPITDADIQEPWTYDADAKTADADVPDALAARTATQAVRWYRARKGSTAYQGYCERAARLSWNRTTHHPSAIEHWRSSDGARHTTGAPPKGAFVFWNISAYGHVGIADGNGGIWATSVHGAIGHATSIHYFANYLGWKRGNSN